MSYHYASLVLRNQAVVRTKIVVKSTFLSLLAEAADIPLQPHTHQQALNVELRPPLASIALECSDKRHHPVHNFVVHQNAGGEHVVVQEGYQQLSPPNFERFGGVGEGPDEGAQDLEVFVQADGDEMGVGGHELLFEIDRPCTTVMLWIE